MAPNGTVSHEIMHSDSLDLAVLKNGYTVIYVTLSMVRSLNVFNVFNKWPKFDHLAQIAHKLIKMEN